MTKADLRREYNRGFAAGLRHAIILALGGECSRCHEVEDPAILHIDHRHGGGNRHRRLVGTGPMYYRSILQALRGGGFRLLCANCDRKTEYLKRTHGRKTS